jgi:hypothetical protein
MGCPLESYITLPSIFYSSYIIFVCCCLKKWKAFKKLFGLDSTQFLRLARITYYLLL